MGWVEPSRSQRVGVVRSRSRSCPRMLIQCFTRCVVFASRVCSAAVCRRVRLAGEVSMSSPWAWSSTFAYALADFEGGAWGASWAGVLPPSRRHWRSHGLACACAQIPRSARGEPRGLACSHPRAAVLGITRLACSCTRARVCALVWVCCTRAWVPHAGTVCTCERGPSPGLGIARL